MSTTDVITAGRPAPLRIHQVLLTVPHLAVLGIAATAVFSFAVSLFSAGIGTALVFGVGLVLLVALLYFMFGVAWLEVERVNGLYGFAAPRLTLVPRERPGFAGWVRSLWRQTIDGRMWAALLSFATGGLLGLLVLPMSALFVWNLVLIAGGENLGVALGPARFFSISASAWPDALENAVFASPWWSVLAAVVMLALTFGFAALHAVIARALLGSPTRSVLAAEVREKSAQREGAVRAADVERTRIERDLHDGVQPRLVSIGMTLGLAHKKIDEDPAAAKALVEEAHTSTKAAITELRQLARGIYASVLDDRGLDAALSALAARSHVPVQLDVRMDGRPTSSEGTFRDAEAAVYFSIAEAITNAAKHSRAAECRVTVRLREPGNPAAALWARIEDNGIGGATVQPGGGLDGISNRVLAAGGTIRIDSPQGGPTAVEVSVPCVS